MEQALTTTFDEVDAVRSLCRASFADFVHEFWDAVPGAGVLVWNWHMQLLCDELQAAAERVFKGEAAEYDEVFNVSPGTSKSTIASILFHPWTWTRMPTARHLSMTHTDSLVMDFADKSREVIKSEKYRACFPEIVLRKDSLAHYSNTLGGDRVSCTVGGKTPMGFHAHFLIGDDLLDPMKALSPAETKTAADVIANYLPTRMTDKRVSVVFLIMQRLGRGDPTEVMLEIGKRDGARPVRRICLPAELTENVHPPELKANYADELMDPVRLPRSVLRSFRARGEYYYAAQFLQDPLALGGGMFKDHYFNQRCKAAPYHARRIRYWDRGATDQGGCATAGVLIADARSIDGSFYVEHVEHGHWEPGERNKRMKATALRDQTKYGRYAPQIWVEREGGSSGRDAWKGVVLALAGFNVREDAVTGSKDVRAEPWSAQLAAGNVYLVDDGTWDINAYILEHCLFLPDPTRIKRIGKLCDRVDASSGGFNLLVKAFTPTVYVVSGKPRIGGPLRNGKRDALPVLVCSREQLAGIVIDDRRCLLVYITDPDPVGTGDLPEHGLNLLGVLMLQFADIDPREYQERWTEPIPPYGKTPDMLMMTREQGKRLMAFLMKRRDPPAEVIVLADSGGRRAESVAFALQRTIRDCPLAIAKADDPAWTVGKNDKPPNVHVFDTTRAGTSMIVH